ncbi:YggS family pyridoxal phosphate-dependent enzyme [Phormidium sp. FACHB-592]|uniref:Pyridoxal phosphate homeostasis protein n=1 Tax=Stenomitos frigidus AS-A4 TaxID=2933935 RepID=A0ABV0KND2_9CYAN|nr:YggS family pyridoxal phosphate-dependent enzyme [Phormidium sp. FACHB-592]MBD2075271.1 YggS family pyridoxal phosphate-dependent enzyme [Phormidium sp. FACHB-592]
MTAFSQLSGTIAERIHQIRQTLPDSVRLLAVTKQVSIELMRAAYDAGVRDFAENRVQEAEAKQVQLHDLTDVTWHLIGHLQSNKAQKALECFQWIHSIDDLKLAQRLNRLAAPLPQKPQSLLQVKLLPDPTKYGWSVAELMNDLSVLNQCEDLRIQGLMTILPYGLTSTEATTAFQQMQTLANTIRQQNLPHIQMQVLSMGMSNDYRFAVQAGATMVRLGRILFGDRPA